MILILAFLICNQKTIIREGFREGQATAVGAANSKRCRLFSKKEYNKIKSKLSKRLPGGNREKTTYENADKHCQTKSTAANCVANTVFRIDRGGAYSKKGPAASTGARWPCCWTAPGKDPITRASTSPYSAVTNVKKCKGETTKTATKKVETKKAATKTPKQPGATTTKTVAKKVVKDATVGLCKAKDKTASWAPDSATIAGCQKAKTQKDCIAEDAAASKAKRAKSTSKGGAISYETMCQWTGTSSTSTPKKGVAAEKSVITSAPVKSGDTLGAGSKGLDVDYVKGSKWKIQVGKKTGALEFRYDGKPVAEISGDGEVKGTQCTCGSWNLRDSRMGIVGRNDINLHTDGWARMLKYGSPEVSKGKHTTADYTKGGWAGKKLYYLKGGKTGTALA